MRYSLCCLRFKSDQAYFCPPPPKRNTGDKDDERESEKIDKVRSALGNSYKLDLHYAVAHMRRWDGAYPPLANDTKAVNLMADTGAARCVTLA